MSIFFFGDVFASKSFIFAGYLSYLFVPFILAQLICVFQSVFALFTYKQLFFCEKIGL
jgi:hypothetical protein